MKTRPSGPGSRFLSSHPALRIALAFVLTLLATSWPVYLELKDDVEELFSKTLRCDLEQHDTPPSFQFASSYKAIFHVRGKRPGTDAVKVLWIGSNLPSVQGNVCIGRAFMADVLDTLATLKPAAVTVDKYYAPHSCDAFPQGTIALQASVARFPAPIVIGQSTDPANTADPNSCLCSVAALPFSGPNVRSGYARLNQDILQVPLRWVVRTEDHEKASYVPQSASYGLAFATAVQLQPALAQRFRAELQDNATEHPYADLWGTEELGQQDVVQFLCVHGTAAVKERWHLPCEADQDVMDVAGKVVVIGAKDGIDVKTLMGTDLYGYEVHARYIAALLGDAVLRPWVLWVQLLFAVVVLAGAEAMVLAYDIDKRLPQWRQFGHGTPAAFRAGWPVMSMVSVLYLGTIVVCMLSMVFGFMPPLGLVASAALGFVNDLRLWVMVKWNNVAQTSEV